MRTRPIPPERARLASPRRDARSAAAALLARRDFATAELGRRLERAGYAADDIAVVLQELAASRALDDARYARNFVSWHAGRGHGPIRIAADLKAAGVEAGLIEAALIAAEGPDWRALAIEQRRRRFGADAPRSWPEKARQARFLQYRGFSSDHIRSALGADFEADSPA